MRRQFMTAAVCLALGTGCGGQQQSSTIDLPLPEGIEEATAAISKDLLRTHVSVIASDDMEGRLPGSDGDRRARTYLIEQMQRLGLEPAFPGSAWEQLVTMVGVTSHLPDTWEFSNAAGDTAVFQCGDDFMGGGGRQEPEVALDKVPVVFVGYGIQAPTEDWDDFKGADLEDKVLLMLNDDPDWNENLFAGERKLWYGRWDYKYLSAARQGAAGAILIHTTASAGYPWTVVCSSGRGEEFELAAGDEPRLALRSWMTEEAARRMVALGGHDLDELISAARSRDFDPVELGLTTSISFTTDIRFAETANVAGLLAGADTELKDEVVVFSAHHDHFGVGEPDQTGDPIYNGALDNGVAVAQVLGIAEAMAALPLRPRRSALFLFVAAEEQGLLGSLLFVRSHVFHPRQIAADINFELGNVWGRTRDVTVYGLGKSELDDLLRIAAAHQGRVLTAETDPRSGWFYRSDQFSFARVGVPSIWFKSGTEFIGRPEGWGEKIYAEWIETTYHQPSDEVDPAWVYDGLVEDARLGLMLGAAVATRDEMPRWFPGDEFEAARRASLVTTQAE